MNRCRLWASSNTFARCSLIEFPVQLLLASTNLISSHQGHPFVICILCSKQLGCWQICEIIPEIPLQDFFSSLQGWKGVYHSHRLSDYKRDPFHDCPKQRLFNRCGLERWSAAAGFLPTIRNRFFSSKS